LIQDRCHPLDHLGPGGEASRRPPPGSDAWRSQRRGIEPSEGEDGPPRRGGRRRDGSSRIVRLVMSSIAFTGRPFRTSGSGSPRRWVTLVGCSAPAMTWPLS